MPNRLQLINSPTDSFVDYFLDSKPYHTKLLEIIETYTFEESMIVSFDERVEKEIIIENDPLCKQTGFGLDFDDECGYDAIDCCDLFDCFAGYGYIFDNSDKLVELEILDYQVENTDHTILLSNDNTGLGSWVEVEGNRLTDTRLPIKRIDSPNTLIFNDNTGEVENLFNTHSIFLIVNVQLFEISGNHENQLYITGNHVDFFLTKNEIYVLNSYIKNKIFYYYDVSYDNVMNRTILHLSRNLTEWDDLNVVYKLGDVVIHNGITYECISYHITEEGDLSPDQDPSRWMVEDLNGLQLQVKNSNNNIGIYQSFECNYNPTTNETTVILADEDDTGRPNSVTPKAQGDYTLGSVQLRTALRNPRFITINETIVPAPPQLEDQSNEFKIVYSEYHPDTNRTRIYVAATLDFLDDVDVTEYSVKTFGYFFDPGFDGGEECSIPKAENIHAGFSERLFVEIEEDFVESETPQLNGVWAAGGSTWYWSNTLANYNFADFQDKFAPAAFLATDWVHVSTGSYRRQPSTAAGIKSDGSLWTWGFNTYGTLGGGTGLDYYSNSLVQEYTSSFDWCDVEVNRHAIAIKKDGTLWGWGHNNYGYKLGLGPDCSSHVYEPTQIGNQNDWKKATVSLYSSAALKHDGTIWTWGINWRGQLANGGFDYNYEPQQEISSSTDWCLVSGGNSAQGHMIGLKNDGSLWLWGNNLYGGLGVGCYGGYVTSPVQEACNFTWVTADAGGSWTGAVRDDGTLWLWGTYAWTGALGRGDFNYYYNSVTGALPQQEVTSSDQWCAVSGGFYHTTGIQKDGTIWSWGTNYGKFGNESYLDTSLPTRGALDIDGFKCVIAGGYENLALRGADKGWRGYLLNGTVELEYITRFHVYGGTAPYSIVTVNLPQGLQASMVNPDIGLVVISGIPKEEVLSFPMSITVQDSTGEIIEVSSSNDFTFDNGSIWSDDGVRLHTMKGCDWSRGYSYTDFRFRRELCSRNDWSKATAGNGGIMGLRQDGTLWSWGYIALGNGLDGWQGPGRSPIQEITNSNDWCDMVVSWQRTSHGLKSDGTIWSWGENERGVLACGDLNCDLAIGTPIQEISSSSDWNCLLRTTRSTVGAIKQDNTLWLWGNNRCCVLTRTNTSGISSPVQEATSSNDWCTGSLGFYWGAGIKFDGTMWTWGGNQYGALANGSTWNTRRVVPAREISSSTNWCQVSSGAFNGAAIKTDGTLWSWGRNNRGQLAIGNTFNRGSPVQEISSSNNWHKVAASYTVQALKTDNTLWLWGRSPSICKDCPLGYSTNVTSPVQETFSSTNWCDISSHGFSSLAAIKCNNTCSTCID